MVVAAVNRSFSSAFWLMEVGFAFFLLFLEGFAHVLWWTLPFRYIMTIFGGDKNEDKTLDMSFVELSNHFGYGAEEHYVQTRDGYVLGMHRIPPKDKSNIKGVVLFQHGFMQNSESFIVRGPAKSIPFKLVDDGYDVWFGNNRGNKYSYKHLQYSPKEEAFWDFCIDDFALSDVPAMVNYALAVSETKTLSYVGFSQGTAQAFAALSVNDELAEKINLFVALAPATKVKQLKNALVAALTTTRPHLVFLLLGRKALLGETLFWRRVLNTTLYVQLIDACMLFLFGWNLNQIDNNEKPILYYHIYSYSSVKCLVHWFQITSSKRFQMYDGNISPKDGMTNHESKYTSYLLPSYQLGKIKSPIAIFHGGRDTIPESDIILSELNKPILVHKEDDYEHLDFIWAASAPVKIFPKVIDLIKKANGAKISSIENEQKFSNEM